MFNGVEMDVIQVDIVIFLVPDNMVPESPLPDHDMSPNVFGLFISMREPEFDGLHDFGNGWCFIGAHWGCQVAPVGPNLTYEIRANSA